MALPSSSRTGTAGVGRAAIPSSKHHAMSYRVEDGLQGMSKVRVHIAVSADGFVAGPNQSVEQPLGEGGEGLHEWFVVLRAFREPHGMEGGEVNASTAVV